MQVYVNQHDFFINKVRDWVDENDEMSVVMVTRVSCAHVTYRWAHISQADSAPPKTEPGLVALFGQIRATMAQESQIVQAVFPNPPLVMQVFLQRVFAQSVRA